MNARKNSGAEQHHPERSLDDEAAQKTLETLMLRNTALSETETAQFKEVFRLFMKSHAARVLRVLTRTGVPEGARADLAQEVFAEFFCFACDNGFPPDIQAKLDSLAAGMAANLGRGAKRDPVTLGVPSSRSETPRSGPDLAKMLDVDTFRHRLLAAFTPEHRAAFEAVVIRQLSHEEAARALGIPRRTLSSRLEAAMRIAEEMAAAFFSPSQRG